MEMLTGMDLGDFQAEVVRKNIKHVHLSVYPPDGRVRISAPTTMALDTIRVYAITKLEWIRRQQSRLRGQRRESPREYLDRESHYVWGKRYLLRLVETPGKSFVKLSPRVLELHLRPDSDIHKRQALLDAWYRQQIREAVPALRVVWEQRLGVKASRLLVQRMKTQWGSCNPATGNIRLNTELARKPPECLEYVLVHELAHLLEPTHNDRFHALLDEAMPNWRHVRHELNLLPILVG